MGFVVSVVTLLLVLPIAYAAWIGAPLVVIPKRAARRMIEAAKLKPEEVAYDLGAGTGRLMIIAKREYDRDVRGIELPPLFWFMGRVNLMVHGIRTKRLERGNFFKKDFCGADVCFAFLMPKTMEKLKPKFEREMRKGSRVVSYAFPVAGWTPERIIKEEGIGAIYLYRI